MSHNVTLSRKQERFLQALILGTSVTDAAETAKVSRGQGHRWLNDPIVQAELERLRTATREAEEREIERIMTTGYAAVHERVKALDSTARLIEASWHDPLKPEVMMYQWLTPDKIREWRGCLDDIASETGGRIKTTKKEVSGGLDITGARDELFNKLKAFADKHDASQP